VDFSIKNTKEKKENLKKNLKIEKISFSALTL
jgi:hypothetical protein